MGIDSLLRGIDLLPLTNDFRKQDALPTELFSRVLDFDNPFRKTSGRLFKQALMTHIIEGLAPIIPEARKVCKKREGDDTPTPQWAERRKSRKSVAFPTLDE